MNEQSKGPNEEQLDVQVMLKLLLGYPYAMASPLQRSFARQRDAALAVARENLVATLKDHREGKVTLLEVNEASSALMHVIDEQGGSRCDRCGRWHRHIEVQTCLDSVDAPTAHLICTLCAAKTH